MSLKKTVIIFDIVVFIAIFIISGLYILCNNSFLKAPSGDYFTDVIDKIQLTNKDKENISAFLAKNIFEIEGINIDSNSKLEVSVSNRHNRADGILKISGRYEKLDKIEEIFKELKLIPSQDDINKDRNIVNYHPDEKNMKDMDGYINKKENKFEISLKQDLFLNPTGLDMKLYNNTIYKMFNSAVKRKITRLIFDQFKICLFTFLGLIIFNILLYMSAKA